MGNSSTDQLNKSFKADLHIHTPKSSDFNSIDPTGIEDYLNILKMAKKENISILGITDHYSIDGYIKLREIKEELEKEFTTASLSQKRLVKKRLQLFQNVFIIPGVEVKTADGVEYIILFNPEYHLEKIRAFINKFNYNGDSLEIQSNDLTREAANLGCINIAAHVDSNHGMYNTTEKNTTVRMRLFKDPNLHGMHFNSTTTCDKIKSYLKHSEYARGAPIAFIKCSDYHNRKGESIGKDSAYLKLNRVDFSELKAAFMNPLERVSSPEDFDTRKILRELLLNENKLCIENLNDSTKLKFLQQISAYLNTNGGYVLVGVSEEGNIKGVDKNNFDDTIYNLLNYCREELDPKLFSSHYSIIPHAYGEKFVISIYFFHKYVDSIVMIKTENKAYKLLKGKPVEASSTMIMDIVTEKIKSGCLQHLDNNYILKDRIRSDIKAIEDSLIVYPILKKIVRNGIPMFFLIKKIDEMVPLKKLPSSVESKISTYDNGNPSGTIAIISNTSARYKNIFLRYSIPTYRANIKGKKNYKKGHVVLCGGAAYIFTHTVTEIMLPPHIDENGFIIELAPSSRTISPEYVVAFLKSSPFLWYMWEKYGELNFTSMIITPQEFKIPLLDKKTQLQITDLVKELCKHEKEYLENVNKIERELSKIKKPPDKLDDNKDLLNNNCNNEICRIALEIDNIFYEKMEITIEERKIITNTLKKLDLCVENEITPTVKT